MARGDGRSPEEIIERGGFHPSASITGRYKTSSSDVNMILDTMEHRKSSSGSGFVSCTSSLRVAKRFSASSPEGDSHSFFERNRYVYLVKITGAIKPSDVSCYADEKEYSAPGGIDAEDIVAYRQVGYQSGKTKCFRVTPIFVNKDFINRYPEKLQAIIHSFLEGQETVIELTPLDSMYTFDETMGCKI